MEEYKGYIIQTAEGTSLKEIVTDGKGSVIKELRGLYTSVNVAKQAIDTYSTRKEVVKDGKTASEPRV